jgi:hypothetical protein
MPFLHNVMKGRQKELDQGLKAQLRLKKMRTFSRIFRTTTELEIKKREAGSLTRLWEVKDWIM